MPPGEGRHERPAVLLVDDLPEKLLVLRTVLETLPAELVTAHSGSEALKRVLEREFAVILLDVNMPDIDGFETAALVRNFKPAAATPIIFVTAYADEMQAAQGYSLGAVDYIVSPVVPEILRSKVRVFLELFEAGRRAREQADERIALIAAQAARDSAEQTARRLEFLTRAGLLLGGAPGSGDPVEPLLALLQAELGGFAAAAIHGDDGGVELLAGDGQRGADAPWRELLRPVLDGAPRLDLDAPARLRLAAGLGRNVDFAAAAVLPLRSGGRSRGALLVAADRRSDAWAALDDIALRLAVALENAQLVRSLATEIEVRREAERRLTAAGRRKDEFLAMLSHELRNPLAPIRNAAEVVRRSGGQQPKLDWACSVIERQVEHLRRLIDELLDVARINQGKVTLTLETLDLRHAVAQAVETARPLLDARRHQLLTELPEHAVWLRGDAARLAQVIGNLLVNAAKYTDEGGRIETSLRVVDGQALLAVRDNGIGIDPELLPRVFDLFEQGQRGLDRAQGGMGIGLTVAQQLVAMHQGTIEARSAGPGQGAEFVVRLPCVTELPAPAPATAPEPGRAPRQGCRVLVVDDNTDAAVSAAALLELAGHDVRVAHDGHEALAIAAVYAPEVVLLDIGLPQVDGYQVAAWLRELPCTRHALLVALTGYGNQQDRERAQRAGFELHLIKPADPAAIAAAIEQHLADKGARPYDAAALAP